MLVQFVHKRTIDTSMARSRGFFLADFNGWNGAFVLLYVLNAVNITLDFGNPVLGTGAIVLMGLQSGIVSLLAFSRRPITALVTIVMAVGIYYVYALVGGIAFAPATWNPGIAYVAPAFHAAFSVACGFLLIRVVKIADALNPDNNMPGLDAMHDAADPAKGKRRKTGGAKLVIALSAFCAVICMAFLLVFPGDAAVQACMVVSLPVMACTLSTLMILFLVSPPAPRSIYNAILTHHVIEDADHTIGVKIGKVTFFLCTRCTAMLSGLFFSMYAFATLRLVIDPFMAFFLDIFIPAPVFIDWGLQRFGFRKARTWSRILTGALTGLGFALVPQASPDYAIHVAIVLMSYFAVFFIIYFTSARRGYYDKNDVELDDVYDPGIGT